MRLLIAVTMILVFTTSCTVIRSSHVSPKADVRAAVPGKARCYALPKKLITIEARRKKNDQLHVEFGNPVIVADPDAVYDLEYTPNWFFSDDLAIELEDGLLKSIRTTTTDQSGEVVLTLAKTATELTKASIYVGSQVADGSVLLWKHTFDPFNMPDYVTDDLDKVGYEFRIDAIGKPLAAGATGQSGEGVFFRPVLPYTVRLQSKDGVGSNVSEVVLMPNEAPAELLAVHRSAFVERVSRLSFSKGMLTSIGLTKPSEALGFTQVPYEIAKGLAQLPKDLLAIKIERADQEAELTAKQIELIQKQIELQSASEDDPLADG